MWWNCGIYLINSMYFIAIIEFFDAGFNIKTYSLR